MFLSTQLNRIMRTTEIQKLEERAVSARWNTEESRREARGKAGRPARL